MIMATYVSMVMLEMKLYGFVKYGWLNLGQLVEEKLENLKVKFLVARAEVAALISKFLS